MTDKRRDYKGVWTLAETDGGRVGRVGYELLARGRVLAEKRRTELTAVVLGSGVSEDDLNELIHRGADVVLLVEAAELEHFLVEPHAACLIALIEKHKPEIFIAGATTTGRTLMPYVAVKVNAGLTADCTGLDIEGDTGNLLQTRPAIGGNIMATIKTETARPQMATGCTSPAASAGRSSTWRGCRRPRASSPSTAIPTPRSSASPTSASSGTSSRSCPC